MKDLQGKVAFITGSTSGIDLALAKVCVTEGMKVILADIDPDDDYMMELSRQIIHRYGE